MQFKTKLYLFILVAVFPYFAFSQYTREELPTLQGISKPKSSESVYEFHSRFIGAGKMNSALTKYHRDQVKENALAIYEKVTAEKEKTTPNKKLIEKETRRYKLHQSMVEQLKVVIEKKQKMEKLCFHKHKNTKRAQDILFKQIVEDSKRYRVMYLEAKSLEKK